MSLFFFWWFERVDQFLLLTRRHGVVMAQFHGEAALSTRQGFEPRSKAIQFRKWRPGADMDLAGRQRTVAAHASAARSQVTADVSGGGAGRRNLESHDGFEHDRSRFLACFLERLT